MRIAFVVPALVALLVNTSAVRAQEGLPGLLEDAARGDARAREALVRRARAGGLGEQLVLARLSIDGAGMPRDVKAGYGWLCLAAHHTAVNDETVRAAWLLAEWFRTGGGLADRGYRGASIDREDPMRAYFWYAVLSGMGARDTESGAVATRLGAHGRRSVGRSLFETERAAMDEAAAAWQPWSAPADGHECLALPPAAGPSPGVP